MSYFICQFCDQEEDTEEAAKAHLCSGRETFQDLEFILRVLRLYDDNDMSGGANLWWRTDGEWAPITFFVNANDLFFWGCADATTITEDNIAILEQSFIDAEAACKYGRFHGEMIFSARVEGMRPQGAAYPKQKELWPLLDACGPERETGFGNPYKPGQYKPFFSFSYTLRSLLHTAIRKLLKSLRK